MSKKRKLLAWGFLFVGVLLWIPSGDIVDMIIRQKEIVLGRYSRGHFSALFLLTIILWGLSALCFSSIKTKKEMVLVGFMVSLSVFVSGFVLIVGSGWAVQPRYVARVVSQGEGENKVSGLVRHRSPNKFYELTQADKPEQKRSYPNAPMGYPTFDLTLTTDAYGFRNKNIMESYSIVAVGDSFAAGSHVSDEQVWSELLAADLNQPIYNLGVSGSNPGNNNNNFMLLGKKFKPKTVIFMIYEGNDFKKVSPLIKKVEPDLKEKQKTLSALAKASPVTKGLRRFSSEVLEDLGKNNPVSEYEQAVGFMPIEINTGSRPHYYGFEPKRLQYLYRDKQEFKQSESWKKIEFIMADLVQQGVKEGFEVLFVYAPSTPHVVMPLVKDEIPVEQLHRFFSYGLKHQIISQPDTFKNKLFDWLDNEQAVFSEYCEQQAFKCLALTEALQEATLKGQQVYFSYDQHWTPEGNQVVAGKIAQKMAEK